MNYKTILMAWWHRLFGKTKFPGVEYQTKYAFTVGGVDYYEMDDLINAPYERGVTCLTYYSEFNQRVDRDYLLKHTEAVDKALEMVPGKPVGVTDAALLNRNLKDRLAWIIDGDLAYKLASVVFFDKNENPTVYDPKYNADKIAFWKKEASVKEFFFSVPMLRLIPFLKGYEENLETYLMVTEKLKSQYLNDILRVLSKT